MEDKDQADDQSKTLRPESCIIPPALPKSELHKLITKDRKPIGGLTLAAMVNTW
jgi:hypothetical protein